MARLYNNRVTTKHVETPHCDISTFVAEWFCGRTRCVPTCAFLRGCDESRPYTALFHFLQNLALFLQQLLNHAFQFVYLLLLALHCGLQLVFLGFQLFHGLDKDWAKG